jgi:hypothetical protein
MGSLDTLFPNPMDCYFTLFQDAIFEHDADNNYVFERGQFKRRDRATTIKRILKMADAVYTNMVAVNPLCAQCKPRHDTSALIGVISRYSRDIYGFRRIKAKLENLEPNVGPTAKKEIESIILESADFGFLIPSSSPYIHREVAVLLYWFSVLKPFSLEFRQDQKIFPETYIISYFNEYFAYSLVNIALHAQSAELTIHKDAAFFKDEFLNQLHYRNLSRSSLEFFLPGWVE